jgi:hypothetical protein
MDNNEHLYVSNQNSNTVTRYNWKHDKPVPLEPLVKFPPHDEGVRSVLYDSANNRVYIAHKEHSCVFVYLYKLNIIGLLCVDMISTASVLESPKIL